MKYYMNQQIEQATQAKNDKIMSADIVLNPEITQQNQDKLTQKPRRKQHINYAKKIMDDPFIMNM